MIFLLFFSPLYTTELDLSQIVGKSQTQIESILGNPTGFDYFGPSTKCDGCKRIYFLNGQIRIIFIDDKSDLIWVDKEIKLLNVDSAKIIAFHNFKDYLFIRVKTVDGNYCCKNF